MRRGSVARGGCAAHGGVRKECQRGTEQPGVQMRLGGFDVA